MGFCETTPRLGDSDNNLLYKIAMYYSQLCPEADAAPRCGDTDNNLLFKIAKSLSICGGSPEACSDPAAPSGLAATMGPGSLLDFDGFGARVVIPDSASLNITTGLTIEALVFARNAVDGGIFEKTIGGAINSSFLLFLQTGLLRFRLVKGAALTTIVGDGAFPLNDWTHVAATWDGATLKLYIDGVLQVDTAALAAPIDTGAGESYIGILGAVLALPFNGQLDEIRVWNVARTQTEILAWKDSPLVGAEPGLAAYWRLDENAGLSAFDSTGNGNTGTLTAGPTWQPSTAFPELETTVSWTDNATNETSYELQYRNLTQGGSYVSTPSLPANSTVTVVTIVGAVDADEIEIQVRSVNGSCASAWVTTTVTASFPIN